MIYMRQQLGHLCNVRIGRTPRRDSSQYWGGSAIWVTVRELNGGVLTTSKEQISDLAVREVMPPPVTAGTLLFSFKLSIGKMAIAGVPLYTNEAIAALEIRDPSVLDRDFLRFALMATSSEDGANHAVLGKVLNKAKVEGLEIPVPPLAEQRRIVDILSRAEGIVRLRREAQKKAAEIIPALFLDMFGDPATNPKGWAVTTLGELVTEFRYGTSQKSGATGLPALRIPNVIGDRLEPSVIKMVDVSPAERDRLRLRNGDLLFVRTNGNPDYVGRSAVFDDEIMRAAGFDGDNCIYASYLIRARLRNEVVNPCFLQAFLSSSEGRQKLKERCRTSAGQYNINTENLASVPLLLPPIHIQNTFEDSCREVFGLTRQQSAATAKAEATFDALLAQAFS